jgi:hypothetical protein
MWLATLAAACRRTGWRIHGWVLLLRVSPIITRAATINRRRAKNQFPISKAFLTLEGIPPETHEYRLGNRSALEWVIDQYQVSTDKRSGITNDPNRPDDPQYIVRLIAQVITVSLETVKIVHSLPQQAVWDQVGGRDLLHRGIRSGP